MMEIIWVCLFPNNFGGGKYLGVLVSQQFRWWETIGYVWFSTILIIENIWACLVLNNFDDGKHLGMFISQQF